jgi:DNA-binding NarL/FixJ family response regulator
MLALRRGQNACVAKRSHIRSLALPARPDDVDGAGEADPGQFQVSASVLAIAIVLSLWMASGNLVLAIIEGLGEHPLRRLVVGIMLVVSIAIALWQRDSLCAALRARPWLVVLIAAAQLGAVVADGALNGAYDAVSVTSIGLAAIVARARTVWICVAVLDTGYAAAVLVDHSPAAVMRSGELAGALGVLLGYPFAALVVLGLASIFTRFVAGADHVLTAMRHGRPALSPALTTALQLGAWRPAGLLDAPSALDDLTRDEIRVVEGLAEGRRPKQIAFDWGVSLATVRKHLRHAKRKTGARTLPELAAMTTDPEWPAASVPADAADGSKGPR